MCHAGDLERQEIQAAPHQLIGFQPGTAALQGFDSQ
jgi:hypothetical protein